MSLRSCLLSIGILLGTIQSASAQQTHQDTATDIGKMALSLFSSGKFREAYETFQTADRMEHSPVFELYMARCKRSAGELLAARPIFEKVANEQLAEGASPNWQNAKADATKELADLDAKTPSIEVLAGDQLGVKATLDGADVELAKAIKVDPGDHVVKATKAAEAPIEKKVHVVEGQPTEHVTIAFPVAIVAPPNKGTPAGEQDKSSWPSGGWFLGGGGVALAAGVIMGSAALSMAGDVNGACVNHECFKADEPKANTAKTLGVVSTIAFITGGALATTGVVLLIVKPGKKSAASVGIGPGSVTARVAF